VAERDSAITDLHDRLTKSQDSLARSKGAACGNVIIIHLLKTTMMMMIDDDDHHHHHHHHQSMSMP
jgi:hypothetical protein